MTDSREHIENAKFEAGCIALDLRDALDAKTTAALAEHLNDAIRRHDTTARHLRQALTIVARRQQVLSMKYPDNLGGGYGP